MTHIISLTLAIIKITQNLGLSRTLKISTHILIDQAQL